MAKPKWLDDLYGFVRCPRCNHRFKSAEMEVVEKRGPIYAIAVNCAKCHLKAMAAVVSVNDAAAAEEPEVAAITKDEVLDAHEALAKIGFWKEVLG